MFKKYAYKEVDNRLSSLCGQLKAVKKMRRQKAPLYNTCMLMLAAEAALRKIIQLHYLPPFRAQILDHATTLYALPNLPPKVAKKVADIGAEASDASFQKLFKLRTQLRKIEKQYGSGVY